MSDISLETTRSTQIMLPVLGFNGAMCFIGEVMFLQCAAES